jgi:hypothetical protein
MTPKPGRALTSLLIGATVVVVGGSVVAVWLVQRSGQDAGDLEFLPVVLCYGLVGIAVVARRPANAVGWIFLVAGVASAIGILCKVIGVGAAPLGDDAPSYAVWAAWVSLIYVELVALPFVYAFLLFPDGRFLTRRWRWIGVAAVVVSAVDAVIVAISDQNFSHPASGSADDVNFPGLEHPLRLVDGGRLVVAYGDVLAPLSVALLVTAVVSVAIRYRRARGVERLQIRWFLASVVVAMTLWVPTIAFWPDHITDVFAVVFPLIPLACGVAILRYRLYDIDRLVSRTVSYALVTGVALAVYLGIVTATTRLLPAQTSAWGVAAATLAAATVFRPLLHLVRDRVDRRFDREHFDATATVDAFGRQLRDVADPERVAAELMAAVRTTVGPEQVGLYLEDRTR